MIWAQKREEGSRYRGWNTDCGGDDDGYGSDAAARGGDGGG